MLQTVLTDDAKADFAAAFAWYEAERAGLGETFGHARVVVHALFHTSRDPARARRRIKKLR